MADSIRCLFLGDSYTAGTAVLKQFRWPTRLTDRMKQSGLKVEPPCFIAGNGWTTQDLMNAMDSEDLDRGFDLVFLLIGVNNQFKGREILEFEVQLDELIARAIRLAGKRNESVFVLAIPDYSVTPFVADSDRKKIASEIELFNQVCLTTARNRSVTFLDTVEISRRAGTDRQLLVADGLHPSGKMYRLWSDFVFEHLEKEGRLSLALQNSG